MTEAASSPEDVITLDADRLKFAIKVLGWSQAEFARRIRVSEAHVSRVLSGLNGVSADVLGRILSAFPGRLEYHDVVRSGVGSRE